MEDFVSLPRRDFVDMDQGDRMNWALAGLNRVVSRALAEGLAPGPRGWVSQAFRDKAESQFDREMLTTLVGSERLTLSDCVKFRVKRFNYPQDLIKDLEHWIDNLRELDGEDE